MLDGDVVVKAEAVVVRPTVKTAAVCRVLIFMVDLLLCCFAGMSNALKVGRSLD